MYDFLTTLTEFRPTVSGLQWDRAPTEQQLEYDAEYGFVVSFGLPPEAMVFFLQLEVNVNAYPMLPGIRIHFVTNAKGKGTQAKARAF